MKHMPRQNRQRLQAWRQEPPCPPERPAIPPVPDDIADRGKHGFSFAIGPFAAKVYESSMDESETGALLGEGTAAHLTMKPLEIRTLRVNR